MRPLSILLLLGLLVSPAAALAPDDREALTSALRALRSGHDDEAARTASEILEDPDRASPDYADFFGELLSADPLGADLARFLGDRALQAGAASARRALQEALARVAVREIENTLKSYLPERFGSDVAAHPARLEHLRSCMHLLARIAYEGDLSLESRREHYERLRAVIASQPGVLRQQVTLDLARQPKLAAIRAQLYKNLQDLLVPFDPERFIADAGFQGDYAELVRNHGVLVLDNNGLDPRQRRAIRDLLALIHPTLHRTYHITVHDLLGNRVGERVEMPLAGSPGVNLFAFPVGSHAGNDFPTDIDPIPVQGFCSLLQHELNHMVDGYAISGVPSRSRRRDQLIRQAGSEPMRYLRSMFEPGFFVANPQEFFASIANEYFSDSFHTLLLAVERFEAGWSEPINQFLFFADVYSRGGDTAPFVVQDAECEYSFHSIPVGRDERGRIDRIRLPGSTLQFQLDAEGNVVR
jgi:hypothetical protein